MTVIKLISAEKNAVILGRSLEVSLPLFALILERDATVTICHSQTQNLSNLTRGADILISAIGQGHMITDEYIKQDTIVIDVGLSPDPETGKLIGDVDYDKVAPLASFITPVPGGIGPMTIACLLSNTFEIWKRKH